MSEKNSIKLKSSRYVQGGVTEFGSIGLEVWEPKELDLDSTDLEYTVENFYEGRLDLIANAFYKTPRLWWFLAQYNAILDPITEITPGRVLRIPSMERIMMFTSDKIGGLNSTREKGTILEPVVV
ncbi:MAG: hypothetical protein QXN55_01835 [Candidatus Nitrosotenuis sp.]